MATSIPITAAMARDQRYARNAGIARQERANHGETLLETQDMMTDPGYVIYVYNIVDRAHYVRQTGFNLHIPPCPKGQKFVYTLLPAYTREIYLKPGSTEYMYKNVDGRKAATSLLNPSAFPGTNFDSQLQEWSQFDQDGNNLNKYGVFWSLTRPDETEILDKEIALFKARVLKTMNELISQAEDLIASGDRRGVSPLMHFAMDYLGKKAAWHMSHDHVVSCPNCGEDVKDGIAYHRNSFGERCIIDQERYEKSIAREAPKSASVSVPSNDVEKEEEEAVSAAAPPAKKTPKKKAATAA
jgi:hypothetical protein